MLFRFICDVKTLFLFLFIIVFLFWLVALDEEVKFQL